LLRPVRLCLVRERSDKCLLPGVRPALPAFTELTDIVAGDSQPDRAINTAERQLHRPFEAPGYVAQIVAQPRVAVGVEQPANVLGIRLLLVWLERFRFVTPI